MDATTRDRLAIGTVSVAVVLALATLLFGVFDPGMVLRERGDQILVESVNDHSVAHASGVQTGMIVTRLNGVTLLRLPELIYPAIPATPDPDTGEYPEPSASGRRPSKRTCRGSSSGSASPRGRSSRRARSGRDGWTCRRSADTAALRRLRPPHHLGRTRGPVARGRAGAG